VWGVVVSAGRLIRGVVLVWEPAVVELAMVEAARTSASPAEIWTICVVAVACLAFWLAAVAVADTRPFWRGRTSNMPGPVLGGMHAAEGGRSVAPTRDAPAAFTEPLPGVPAQRVGESEPTGAPAKAGQPVAAGQPVPTARSVPAQRSGEADRPEHSVTGSGTAKQHGTGRGGMGGA
jgi:hypothetical protein